MSLEYALRYAAAGLRVHPLYEVDPATQVCACPAGAACTEKQRGKHPRLGGWQTKATTDADEVRAWWTRWPRAGIGLATGSASRCWVLDLDGPEAGAWYEAQVAKHGLTRTLGVHTSRGFHLYWRWTDAAMVRNAQGLKAVGAPNVDVRGEGGYVCAPPTVHRSGHVYTWETQLAAFQREMVEAPAWLLDIVKERPKPKREFKAPTWAITERELAREIRTRLDHDEGLRQTIGLELGGTFRPAARPYVDDLRCPNCGDREAWYYIDAGPVVCHHRNSCGWAGSLDALRRQS
jgi:hypothetical protein